MSLNSYPFQNNINLPIMFCSFLYFVLISCKTDDKNSRPSFLFEANRKIEVDISSGASKALSVLANRDYKIQGECGRDKLKFYRQEFYYQIDQSTKNLIVIDTYVNQCVVGNSPNVSKSVSKHIIPIELISWVDRDATGKLGPPVPKGNHSLHIQMKFNSESIKTFSHIARGNDESIGYTSNEFFEDSILLYLNNQNSIEVEKAINTLISEFQN